MRIGLMGAMILSLLVAPQIWAKAGGGNCESGLRQSHPDDGAISSDLSKILARSKPGLLSFGFGTEVGQPKLYFWWNDFKPANGHVAKSKELKTLAPAFVPDFFGSIFIQVDSRSDGKWDLSIQNIVVSTSQHEILPGRGHHPQDILNLFLYFLADPRLEISLDQEVRITWPGIAQGKLASLPLQEIIRQAGLPPVHP